MDRLRKTYPPKAHESEKIAFLDLMKAPSKVNDESKNNDESKYEQAKEAFSSAYHDYKLGYLPNTPAKEPTAHKLHYQTYSDVYDAKLIEECEREF